MRQVLDVRLKLFFLSFSFLFEFVIRKKDATKAEKGKHKGA